VNLGRGHLQEVITDTFDPKSKKSAQKWMRDIAQVVDQACEMSGTELSELGLSPEDWENLYKPALLWRFYRHLGSEVNQMAEGHAQVLLHSLQDAEEEECPGES